MLLFLRFLSPVRQSLSKIPAIVFIKCTGKVSNKQTTCMCEMSGVVPGKYPYSGPR